MQGRLAGTAQLCDMQERSHCMQACLHAEGLLSVASSLLSCTLDLDTLDIGPPWLRFNNENGRHTMDL